MVGRSAIIAAFVIGGVACTALSGLSSLSEVPGDASNANDGGPRVDRVEGGDSDTQREGGVSDAARADAATDSGADADGFDSACPGYPDAIFCDDFDKGPLGARWTQQSVIFGSLSLSSTQAFSPPFALLAQVYDGGPTGEGSASLVLDLSQAYGRIRNSYDVYFEQIGQRSAAIGSVYHLTGSTDYYGLYLFAHGGNTMEVVQDGTLSDGGEEFSGTMFPSIQPQTWTRVILDVDFAAATFTLSLEVPPGTTATVAIPSTPITPTISGTSSSVIGGIDYVAFPETTGWIVYVDNVVIETP